MSPITSAAVPNAAPRLTGYLMPVLVLAMSFLVALQSTMTIGLGVMAFQHSEVILERLEAAAQPFLDSRVVETSADESLSTTPQRIDCGKSASPRSWKCIDTAAGGVTVYRGDADVTSSTGFPESADTVFGGDSVAYLVLASSTLTVRCVCGE